MAPVLVPRLFQLVESHAIDALGFLASLPNPVPGGDPLVVTVRPRFADLPITAPLVTVAFRPGRHDFDVGENFQDFDDVQNVTKWGVYLPRSTLTCRVYAQHPGECGYIADSLYSGILSNFSLNPTTGEAVEGAVIKRLAETAITVIGCEEIREIESNPSDARPLGQLWQMILPFRVNVDVLWQGESYTPTEIDLVQSLYPAGDSSFTVPLTTETFVVTSS